MALGGPLCLLLLVLISLHLSRAQFPTCEPFGGSPSVCADLITYNVWVPPNFTQAMFAQLLESNLPLINILPGDCARASIMVACSQTFRACGSSVLPAPLCPPTCSWANEMCAGTDVSFNCSDTDAATGGPLWLYESPSISNGPPDACQIANASTPLISCPYPFIWHPEKESCLMKCPPVGLDNEKQQYTVWVTAWVLSTLSLIGCLFHIPPMILQYRGSAGGYALWWFVCQAFGNLGILCGHWQPWDEFLCRDKWNIRNGDSFYCGLSFLFNYFGYLNSTLWVVFIMYRILCAMTRGSTSLFAPSGPISFIGEHKAFLIIGFVPHTIAIFVIFGLGWVSAASSYTCQVDPAKWHFYPFVLIPLTVYVSLSTLLAFVVIFYVAKNGIHAIVTQWRIFALSVYYTFTVVTVVTIAFYGTENTDETFRRVMAYVMCVVTSARSNCAYHPPLAWGVNYLAIFLTVSVAFFMSLLFLTKSTFSAWRYIIGKVTGLYKVNEYKAPGSTTANSNSSHGL